MTLAGHKAASDVDELDEPETDDQQQRQGTGSANPATEPSPRWVNILLATSLVLVIAAPAVAAWVFFAQFRPAQEIDPVVEQQVLTTAADGTIAVLSYAPATLDADFAKAKGYLTGNFLAYYDKFSATMLAPAAAKADAMSTASVIRKAIVQIAPDSATVLLFVNQSTSSKDNPEPGLQASVVRVELVKENDTWRIAELGPV